MSCVYHDFATVLHWANLNRRCRLIQYCSITKSRTPPPGQGLNREGNGNDSVRRGGMTVRDMLSAQGQAADSGWEIKRG